MYPYDLDDRLQTFLAKVQDKVNSYYKEGAESAPTITLKKSRRYAKLITENYSQKSAFCFVDLTNGDILKCASWSAPAKGARGNIQSEDFGLSCITQYGAKYLR